MPRIPLFITNALRTQLRDAGYSEDDIDQMTPNEAWEHVGGLPDDPLLETALQLFDAGFAVVPIVKGDKRPAVTKWQTQKLPRETLQKMLQQSNGNVAGIGVIAGALSGNLIVLDFDGDGWEGVYEYVISAWPELQQSVIVQTGSGKKHIWIRCPDMPSGFTNHKFKAPLLGAIIELRGNRSNNVAPPSIHPSGNTYEWLSDELELAEVPFQALYDWLSEWADETETPKNGSQPVGELVERGNRNDAMTSLAGSMRRRGMSFEAILAAITLENQQKCSPPLPDDEIRGIVNSVMRYAPGDPLQALEDVAGDSRAFLLREKADDEGNAQCLVKMFPNKFLYTSGLGWLYYNGRYWETEGAETILDRHIVRMLTERSAVAKLASRDDISKFCKSNAGRVQGCKTLLTSIVWANTSEFDSDKDLLNCRNGVVDLRTGSFVVHSPEQRFTYALPVDFTPNADPTYWENWLLETVGGDQGVATYIQIALGYSLTGHTTEECMFYLYGPTRSGKGTFTQTILAMLGAPLSTEVDFATFTAQRDTDAQNFDLAGLRPARFVAASESNKYQVLNSRRIKAVTGGDNIRAAFKYRDLFTYKPQFKIWLSSNEMVNADVEDDAIWGRVHVITFPHSYLGREDKGLKRRMLTRENLQGVLSWAVTGAAVWYASLPVGLEKPGAVTEETQKHRDEHDYVALFLDEMFEPEPNGFVANRNLYPLYKNWCADNGVTPMHQRNLSRALKNKGYILDLRRRNGEVLRGVIGIKVRL